MDSQRFDRLTKTLATAGSRRRVLGAVLAGMLGSLGTRTTIADESEDSGTVIADASGGNHNQAIVLEPDPAHNDRDRDRDRDDDNNDDKDKHHDEDPDAGQCGPFVEPCPGNPQCGSFGRPCPGDAQCVAGTCGGSCPPSTGFECTGTRGRDCCASRGECCGCRDNVTGETYGYCTSVGSPCRPGTDFGPNVVCGHV